MPETEPNIKSDGKRRDLDLVATGVILVDGETVDEAVVPEARRTPLRLGLEAWADN